MSADEYSSRSESREAEIRRRGRGARGQYREVPLSEALAAPADPAAIAETKAIANQQLQRAGVPSSSRAAYLMRHWLGFDAESIAFVLGCSRETVDRRIRQTQAKLRAIQA